MREFGLRAALGADPGALTRLVLWLSVANSDNGLRGEGAAWKLMANRRELAAGELSEDRVIRWQFDGLVPEPKQLVN